MKSFENVNQDVLALLKGDMRTGIYNRNIFLLFLKSKNHQIQKIPHSEMFLMCLSLGSSFILFFAEMMFFVVLHEEEAKMASPGQHEMEQFIFHLFILPQVQF